MSFIGRVVGLAVVGTAGLVPVSADDKQEEPKIVVPFVPTHPKVVAAMLKLANVDFSLQGKKSSWHLIWELLLLPTPIWNNFVTLL